MSIINIILIGVGLSVDALTVSFTAGVCNKNINITKSIKIALAFAIFQMLMPVVGWFLGDIFASKLQVLDHWVAFSLLSIIGIKMIIDSFKKDKECPNFSSNKVLILLAIATSIDALAIGLTLALLKINIIIPAIIIGVITFTLCIGGIIVGKKLGDKLGNTIQTKMQILGGVVLIGIGLRILLSHTL